MADLYCEDSEEETVSNLVHCASTNTPIIDLDATLFKQSPYTRKHAPWYQLHIFHMINLIIFHHTFHHILFDLVGSCDRNEETLSTMAFYIY
mmetsp:Transcript_1181/g.1487  ORF Transcript_1181/g.1487 Transcript_1181/m.1487 type:complete len:92 (+) Transcript_1181:448-723(+)